MRRHKPCRTLWLLLAFAFAAVSGCNCGDSRQTCTHSRCVGFPDWGCCTWPEECVNGYCACPSGLVDCGEAPWIPSWASTCTDLGSDSSNCGSCGNACSGETVCQGGKCKPCPSGLAFCVGWCVDLATNTANCGACGNFCMGGVCDGGICTCQGGSTWCGSACVDLATDTQNCGKCGNSCGASSCVNGHCQ